MDVFGEIADALSAVRADMSGCSCPPDPINDTELCRPCITWANDQSDRNAVDWDND